MRRAFLVAIVLIALTTLHGQGFPFEGTTYYVPFAMEFSFSDGQFQYINYYQRQGDVSPARFPETKAGPYELRQEEGFTIARVEFPSGSRDLILFHEGHQLIVYDTELGEAFFGQKGQGDGVGLFPVFAIEATSFFTEILGGKEVRYVANNLTDYDITNHWVEGVPGYGEGEKLFMEGYFAHHLVILNGFFAPGQLTLYRDNGRLKQIRLRGFAESGEMLFEQTFDLLDTPNLQLIEFPEIAYDVEMEIIEVYAGRRFEDTAVSGLFFDGHRHLMFLRDSNEN